MKKHCINAYGWQENCLFDFSGIAKLFPTKAQRPQKNAIVSFVSLWDIFIKWKLNFS